MAADDLVQLLSQLAYVLIFFVVAAAAIRHPRRVTIDIALFFGVAALVIAVGWAISALGIGSTPLWRVLSSVLIMAMPYLLLRLVDDFASVPPLVMYGAAAGLLASIAGLTLIPAAATPVWLRLLYVAYFVGLEGYAAVAFVRSAGQSRGVTRRRMQSAAIGSLCLALTIAAAGVHAALPAFGWQAAIVSHLLALGSGLGYFLGFAPPTWLRRSWQEPELRAFLARAARLPRLPSTRDIVDELTSGAATAVGASGAAIGLWDADYQVLRFRLRDGTGLMDVAPGEMVAGRVFAMQRPLFVVDATRDDPAHAEVYESTGARAVLAAPITAGASRLGVLAVYAQRAPIFADDDLNLVRLLADQAAVILESRALIDEAARVHAREEATRLKDDFLSAAAHDLKTPLATLLLQAQMFERRASRNPELSAELPRIGVHIAELQRLRALVLELLDAARAEQGRLTGAREPVDLAEVVRDLAARQPAKHQRYRLDVAGPIVGVYDRVRLRQVVENLLDNAAKYSPAGGEIAVRTWHEGDAAHLTVGDQGIGIPAADLTAIFNRFQRGANVDDRRYAGLGLGLFICRRIVEEHGGRIWATSPGLGRGSTFHVVLPARPTPTGEQTHDHADAPSVRTSAGYAG